MTEEKKNVSVNIQHLEEAFFLILTFLNSNQEKRISCLSCLM